MTSVETRALSIVEQALDHEDNAARARLVAALCGDDAALHARVNHLLALDGGDAPFLHTESFVHAFGLDDVVAERIGPYRVTGEIARGGMGTVVKAERDDGLFQQTVAIKLIRGDIATDQARTRFAEERRILARLRHPAIVRILDGGEHADRPWLAMDFIEGLPVTEALARAEAPQAARLAAFSAICEAVAHAHRALVIHADIKPGNVLMSADGAVHLLDFGIARLVDELVDELGDGVGHAGTAPSPLTRAYAAPERGGGAPPTVASDVFGLGMLMVEMLTGRAPIGEQRCEPGTRLPLGWLKGDLAAIAGCALAVTPQARYPDVAGLIEDLRRFGAHLPVRARATAPWGYFAGLFVRRHRRGIALTAVLIAMLASTTVVSTLFYWRADAARTEAEARFADARGAARYMIGTLMPRLESVPGALRLRVDTAAAAQGYLERLSASREASDDVRIETADGLLRLAQMQGRAGRPNLAQPERAEANLRKAEALLAPIPRTPARTLLAHVLYERVGLAAWMKGDQAEAERLAQRAEAVFHKLPAPDNALARSRARVLADLNGWQGRFAEQKAMADAGLALIGSGASLEDGMDRFHLLSAKAEGTYYGGDIPEALRLYRERLNFVNALRRQRPDDPFLRGAASVAAWEVATCLMDLHRADEAVAELRPAEADALAAVAFDPADDEAQRRLRIIRNARAQALGLTGKTDAALALLAQVRAEDARLQAADPTPRRTRDLVYDYSLVGEAMDAAGRKPEACTADRKTLQLYADLSRRGLLMALDMANNVKLLKERVARNCPR